MVQNSGTLYPSRLNHQCLLKFLKVKCTPGALLHKPDALRYSDLYSANTFVFNDYSTADFVSIWIIYWDVTLIINFYIQATFTLLSFYCISLILFLLTCYNFNPVWMCCMWWCPVAHLERKFWMGHRTAHVCDWVMLYIFVNSLYRCPIACS